MSVEYNFAPATRSCTWLFGAARPAGYNDDAIAEWIQFMRQHGVERVVWLHGSHLVGSYEAAFGTENVLYSPIRDFSNPHGRTC